MEVTCIDKNALPAHKDIVVTQVFLLKIFYSFVTFEMNLFREQFIILEQQMTAFIFSYLPNV